MANDENFDLFDDVEGDVTSLDEIDGDVNGVDDIDGDIEPDGDELEGDVEIATEYFKAASINGHPLDRDYTSVELDIEVLKAALDASKQVGGVNIGDHYDEGTMLETIIRDMLNPVENPRLVDPSASLSATGDKILEKGGSLNTVVTVSFNRGQINPAYGTSGYRSGPATGYSLNGSQYQASNSFFYTVTEQDNSLNGSVEYSEGEQPKNSIGEDYAEPLPAGTVRSSSLTYEFVNALWANTANIQVVAKQALVSFSAKVKEFNFPEQTVLFPEIFDVPADWNVTAVEVLNTLSNTWEDCSGEFNTSNTVHDDAGGNPTNYIRYTDNRGYNAGARKVRIKWS